MQFPHNLMKKEKRPISFKRDIDTWRLDHFSKQSFKTK